MLNKVAFYEQQSFALFGINNSDFFALSEKKDFLAHLSLHTLKSDKIGTRRN